MKILCPTHGAHFPEDFHPRCPIWELWGLKPLSYKDKRVVWDYMFGLNVDYFAVKYNIGIQTDTKGFKLAGNAFVNEFERDIPGYASLSDKQRKAFQKDYFKNPEKYKKVDVKRKGWLARLWIYLFYNNNQ